MTLDVMTHQQLVCQSQRRTRRRGLIHQRYRCSPIACKSHKHLIPVHCGTDCQACGPVCTVQALAQ